MSTPFHQRLYLRIWFAVVATIAIVAAVAGWLGNREVERERAQRPGREITIKSASGEVLGQARARPNMVPGQGAEFQVAMKDGSTVVVQFSRPPGGPGGPGGPPGGQSFGPGGPPGGAYGGLSRPPSTGQPRLPFSFVWLLVVLAVAVGIGAYPIARRLTRRLETVQSGVQRWGDGDLSFRLPEEGKDEVGYLARQFNQSAQRIEQLMDSQKLLLSAQRSLLANASHELRSPLARIKMGLELMQSSQNQTNPELQSEVSRSINELDQLIEEILLASRLDAQEADMGTVEAVDIWHWRPKKGPACRPSWRPRPPANPIPTGWCKVSPSCCAVPCAICWKTRSVMAKTRSAFSWPVTATNWW